MASKVYLSMGFVDETESQEVNPQSIDTSHRVVTDSAFSLFKFGHQSRDLTHFLDQLQIGFSEERSPELGVARSSGALFQLKEFLSALPQEEFDLNSPRLPLILSTLDEAVGLLLDSGSQQEISVDALDARVQLVEVLHSVLEDIQSFSVVPTESVVSLAQLSSEEPPENLAALGLESSSGSFESPRDNTQLQSEPATGVEDNQTNEQLDVFGLDSDQGFEVASGVLDLTISAVDPTSVGIGGFLPAGALGGGGGGGAGGIGVEGVLLADLPPAAGAAPATPVGPSGPVPAPPGGGFSSSSAGGGGGRAGPPNSLMGRVIDGYVEGATVFVDLSDENGVANFQLDWTDLNGNNIWDSGEGEVWAITDSQGGFSFTNVSRAQLAGQIVSLGGVDVTTLSSVDMLVAPKDKRYVTPVSTIYEYANRAGLNGEDLLEAMGLSQSDLNYDPAALAATNDQAGDQAAKVLKVGASLLTVAKNAAALTSDLGNLSATDSYSKVFSSIAELGSSGLTDLLSTTNSSITNAITTVLRTSLSKADIDVDENDFQDLVDNAAKSVASVTQAIQALSPEAIRAGEQLALASAGQSALVLDLKSYVSAMTDTSSTEEDRQDKLDALMSGYVNADIAKLTQTSAVRLAFNKQVGSENIVTKADGLLFGPKSDTFDFLANDTTVTGSTLKLSAVGAFNVQKAKQFQEAQDSLLRGLKAIEEGSTTVDIAALQTGVTSSYNSLIANFGVAGGPEFSINGISFVIDDDNDEDKFKLKVTRAPDDSSVQTLELLYVVERQTASGEATSDTEVNFATINIVPAAPSFVVTPASQISEAFDGQKPNGEQNDAVVVSELGVQGSYTPISLTLKGVSSTSFDNSMLGVNGAIQVESTDLDGSGAVLVYTIKGSDKQVFVKQSAGVPNWIIEGAAALQADLTSLKLLLPSNASGDFQLSISATARYGALSNTSSPQSVTLSVKPVADGPRTGNEASQQVFLSNALVPLNEDSPGSFFKPSGSAVQRFVDSIQRIDADGSESLALRFVCPEELSLGIPSSSTDQWIVDQKDGVEPSTFDVFFKSPSSFREDATNFLKGLTANISSPNYSGSMPLEVLAGTFELAELSNNASAIPSSPSFLNESYKLDLQVNAKAEVIELAEVASTRIDLIEDTPFLIELSKFIDTSHLNDDDEIVTFRLTLPRQITLQDSQGNALVPVEFSSTSITYLIQAQHSDLQASEDSPPLIDVKYQLMPEADFFTEPTSQKLPVLKLMASTTEPSNPDSQSSTGDLTVDIFVKGVAEDPGVLSVAMPKTILETQAETDSYTLLSTLIRLPVEADAQSSGDALSLILKDRDGKLEFAIRDESFDPASFTKLEPQDGNDFIEVAAASFSSVVVRGKPFVSGEAEIQASLVSTSGLSRIVGEEAKATLLLKPVASGILSDPSLVVVGEQGQTPVLEDGAGALLSQFIGTNGAAVQLDASEALFYRVYIPDSAKLVSVQSDSQAAGFVRPPLATREIVSNKSYLTYLVPEDDLAGLKVLPNSNVAGELIVKFRAVSVETDGSRTEGSIQTTSLIVTPVADMPVLVAPDAVAGTISATNSSLAIPVQAALRDTTVEVLGVRIEISGIQSTQDLTFMLGIGESAKPLTVTSDGQSFVVEVLPEDVSQLSSLRVSSANDYRGAEKITLTIKAIATDAFPSANGVVYSDVEEASQTVSLSIYQPVGVPTFNLGPDVEAITQGAIAFTLSLPEPWVNGLGDVSYDDTSVLMTGVPSTAYFAVKSGGSTDLVPVGATLGEGGVWLFAGSDIYQGVTPKTLYIINGGSVAITNGSMSATAYIADPTGGTTNQSLSDTLTLNFDPGSETYKDASDPVILSLNGDPLSSAQAGGFSFELNSSVTGVETPTYWVSGDATNLSGFAFLVRPGVGEGEVDALADLYADFTEVAEFDANQDGVVTASELSVGDAFASLWFDEAIDNTAVGDGVAQPGELVSLEGFEDFAITLPPRLAREAADGEIIPLYEAGLRYTPAGTEVSTEGLAYATGIPYNTALGPATEGNVGSAQTVLTSKPSAAIYVVGEHKSTGISSDPVEVPEDLEGGVRFRVELNPADLASGVQGSLTHLVKISGVPPEAKLSAGAFVPAVVGTESKPASEAFWVVTESQAQNTLSVIGLPENYTGTLSLTATPVASLVTGSGASSVITVLSGPTSSVAVANVVGVADDPLISSLDADNEDLDADNEDLDADNEVSLAEGDELSNLQSLVSLARSTGDSEEDLYLRFSLDTDASNFVVTGKDVAEVGMGSGLYEVKWDDVANVNINFNSFYQTETTLSLQGVSKQGTSYALSGTTVEIKLDFYPVADGVEKGKTLTQGLDTVEGSSAVISSIQTTVLDPSEMAQFELLVKLSRAFGETNQPSPNDLLGISSPSVAVVERELAPSDFARWGLGSEAETQDYRLFVIESPTETLGNTLSVKDLSLELDKFFDGSIHYKLRAFSVDPATGEESGDNKSEVVDGLIHVAPVVEDGTFLVTISNAEGQPIRRLTLDESGQSEPFFASVEAFDLDEFAQLSFDVDLNFFEIKTLGTPEDKTSFVLVHKIGAEVPTSSSALTVTPRVLLRDDSASISYLAPAQSFSVRVNKAVTTPEFSPDTPSVIQVSMPDGVSRFVIPLPARVNASDDTLSYSLKGVPVWLTPSSGTLTSASEGYSEYQFSAAQLEALTWNVAREYLIEPSAPTSMEWKAIHVEPSNLRVEYSEPVSVEVNRTPVPDVPLISIPETIHVFSTTGFRSSEISIDVSQFSGSQIAQTVRVLLTPAEDVQLLFDDQVIEVQRNTSEELSIDQLNRAILRPQNPDYSGDLGVQLIAKQVFQFGSETLEAQSTPSVVSLKVTDDNPPESAQIVLIDANGGIPGDDLTNDTTPVLTVKAEPGAQLRLYKLVRNDEGDFLRRDSIEESSYSVTESATAEAGMSTYTLTVREPVASGDYGIEVIDGAGNTSPLIGPSTFRIDQEAPSEISMKPMNDGKTAGLSSNFELEFSEQVRFGASGSVMLYRKSIDEEDYLVETFEVTDPKGLTIEEGVGGSYKLVVDPELRLEMDRQYYLLVTEGAITDMAGNFYAGVSSSTDWTFTAPGLDITISDASALFGGDGVINAEEGAAPVRIGGMLLGEASILTALDSDREFKAFLRPLGDASDSNEILLESLTFSYSEDGLATWAAEIPAFELDIQKAYELVLEIKGFSGDANGIEATTFLPLQVDTKAPTAEISLSDTELKIGDDMIVTVRFSEAVQAATLGDLIVQNGVVSELTNGQLQPDGSQTYTAVFRPYEGIEVPNNAIKLQGLFADLAGNYAAEGAVLSGNYEIDTKAPGAAAYLQGSGGVDIPQVIVVPLENQAFPEDLSRIDIQLGLGAPVYSMNRSFQEAFFTVETSSLGLNPDSVLTVIVNDHAGNQFRIPVEINNTEDLFFGVVQDGSGPRANFSNLGTLATETDESSSFAFIDAGLGYVISDDASLNNLEIAETLGIKGSKGDDYMVARDQGSVLLGGTGKDTLLGSISQDYLDGGDDDDVLVPLGAPDVLRTGSGDDLIEISADAFYEQTSRTQMEDLLLRVTQADQADVRSILDQLESAQAAWVEEDAHITNRFVGLVQDFSFDESGGDNDVDNVAFSGFSSEVMQGDIVLQGGGSEKLSYRFVKEFANPASGSEDPDYIFTSILLSSDANAWTMAVVDEQLSETTKSQ